MVHEAISSRPFPILRDPWATNAVEREWSKRFPTRALKLVGTPMSSALAVRGECDIAAHSNQFVLTDDGNLLVHFALGIEPTQRRSAQCSDCGEMSAPAADALSACRRPCASVARYRGLGE